MVYMNLLRRLVIENPPVKSCDTPNKYFQKVLKDDIKERSDYV